jgi:hypothetical protein
VQAGGAELLEAVCPGHVVSRKEMSCRGVCPKFTSFSNEKFRWSLALVTRGHFVSPSSEDAVLSMNGCEPHSENFGGTILLTRRAQRWTMLWYKPGVDTGQCHKVSLPTAREILVCLGDFGGQGNIFTELYVEDLLAPRPSLMAGGRGFFQLFDNTFTCGWNIEDHAKPDPLMRAFIEKVEFETTAKTDVAPISVTAHFGKRSMKPADVQACEEYLRKRVLGSRFVPPTKTYRLDFIFAGHDYKLTRSSAAVARIFGR